MAENETQVQLNDKEKNLLEIIQQDFPMITQPFEFFANTIGLSESDTIAMIKDLQQRNIIREISAILEANRLNHKSALVAVHVPESEVDEISTIINSHPAVSHNYQRNHFFNVWFTISVPEDRTIENEVAHLLQNRCHFRVLPAIKTFKIGVHFRFGEKKYDQAERRSHSPRPKLNITEEDKEIIRLVQSHLPIESRPWQTLSASIGWSEEKLIEKINYLKNEGVIKRISAVIRHRNVGISHNGMCCFEVAPENTERDGNILANHPQVTHCYQRQTYPDWQYSLFGMVHGNSQSEVENVGQELKSQIQCTNHIILFSSKEFKKERVKYFMQF